MNNANIIVASLINKSVNYVENKKHGFVSQVNDCDLFATYILNDLYKIFDELDVDQKSNLVVLYNDLI